MPEPTVDRTITAPRFRALAVAAATLLILVGAVANNVTLATQDMTDYLPLLWFGIVSFLSALGLLSYSAIRGGIVARTAAGLLGLLAAAQLLDASARLLSISTGT